MLMQKWKWKYNWKYKCVYSFLCTRCIVHQIILLACYSKIYVVALPLLQCVFELASIRQICFWKLVEIMAVGNFPSRDALIRRSSSLIDMEVIVTVKLKQLAMSSVDWLIDWLRGLRLNFSSHPVTCAWLIIFLERPSFLNLWSRCNLWGYRIIWSFLGGRGGGEEIAEE